MTVIAPIHPIAQKALADELRSDHRADVDSILALDSEAPMPRHPLDRSRAIHRDFESVAVFDLSGTLQLQSGEPPTDNPKNQDYFQTALKTKRPTIGQPERMDGTELYQLHFAAPI